MAYSDKTKQAEYAKNHYLKNSGLIKKRAAAFKKKAVLRNQKFVLEFLLKNFCVDCEESNPVVLEFDHVRDTKTADISFMVKKGCSTKTIQEEIEKCEVRCANCHRKVTYARAGRTHRDG